MGTGGGREAISCNIMAGALSTLVVYCSTAHPVYAYIGKSCNAGLEKLLDLETCSIKNIQAEGTSITLVKVESSVKGSQRAVDGQKSFAM